MRPEDLDVAAQFCAQVGAPSLLAYLGVDERADATAARTQLRARRKFMQGMQGNPKYKKEALLLIKHFQSLHDALEDLPAYLRDARRRAESEHLPVVEMTIRGVCAGGPPSADQLEYLRRNAAELGVSEGTFRELLARVEREVAAPRPVAPAPAAVEAPRDLPSLLGLPPSASEDDVRAAWRRRMADLDAAGDAPDALRARALLESAGRAWSTSGGTPRHDLAAATTGPPSRERRVEPPRPSSTAAREALAATAPPVRPRQAEPMPRPASRPERPARLEILGDPARTVPLTQPMTLVSITVRNGGDGEMGGSVSTDVPWAAVDPARLDPRAREQVVSVQVDPSDLPAGRAAAVVTIRTDRGEQGEVTLEFPRARRLAPAVALALVVAGLGAAALGCLGLFFVW